MHACVFCQIVAGEAPADLLYADEAVAAFFDIAPINLGHALVVPREHHASLTTVPCEVLGRMMQVAAALGQAQVRELEADGFNLHLANGRCAGQEVFHAHLHVVPRRPDDGFAWHWRKLTYESDAQRRRLASALADRLARKQP